VIRCISFKDFFIRGISPEGAREGANPRGLLRGEEKLYEKSINRS